jgi:hypothetical protein
MVYGVWVKARLKLSETQGETGPCALVSNADLWPVRVLLWLGGDEVHAPQCHDVRSIFVRYLYIPVINKQSARSYFLANETTLLRLGLKIFLAIDGMSS